MKTLLIFFKLWFGQISECWNDAKIMNDNTLKDKLKQFDKPEVELNNHEDYL